MLRTHRGAGPGAALVTATVLAAVMVLAVGLLQSPGEAAPTADRHRSGPAYKNSHLSTDERVADLLARMTLAEKIGQMTQAERVDVDADPSLITTHALGSILSGGGSTPTSNTPEAWADMVDRYQEAALETRLGIPLLYGVDSVHGHSNLQGATVFPHNIGLGATRDPDLVEKIGHLTAIETRASGPQWAFAPCVCVARDDRWGRTYESFGEDPRLAIQMETAIDGLQGDGAKDLAKPDRVLATAKHYAGDGLTAYGTGEGDYTVDQGIDQVSREEWDRLALAPYKPAVRRHHVGSVMPSFSSVDWTEDGLGNPVKMHADQELITGVLKDQLGFDGIVVSDWRAIRQLPGDYREQVRASVLAGVDMFMEPIQAPNNPDGWDVFIPTLTSLVEDGTVPMSRIDDAVTRILTAKFDLGLFEHPFTDRRHIDSIGSKAHRKVARRAVAESQVLLKNKQHTLPLSTHKSQPVYVAGSNADNIGNQAGGWTLTWQGGSTNVIPGQTVLDAVRATSRGRVQFSETAADPVPSNAAGVVVVGETPYAEGFGDVNGPQWAYDPGDHGQPRPKKTMELSDADALAVRRVCSHAASCTVLVVSGRPMIIPPELLAQIDALVASWLPGSEGMGVADVLFGAKPFTGRLPVTWPRTVAQEPINVGDADYDALYRYGFGLGT
ncbi:glycoside hydrolase family 3 protein [Nocardioides halotolerans]|uniref:glycoside hydrolase family 3 protein n=1 Tax=Nocardioides halotolerans TaxID=433660 RepID=UPI00041316C2|nr:glycoside hydrolase family 3 N-terminal domain-containing protein [Nocardioides halotolerans]